MTPEIKDSPADARPRLEIVALPYHADPAVYFERLRQRPGAAMLDSGRPEAPGGRFDILTSDPLHTLTTRDGVTRCEPALALPDDPFAAQQALLDHGLSHRLPRLPSSLEAAHRELPFLGGLLGYWSYSLSERHRPDAEAPDRRPGPALPAARLGLYDWALIQDHDNAQSWLVASATRRAQVHQWLTTPSPTGEAFQLEGDFTSDLTRGAYGERFRRVLDYLTAGDCYQINLTQRFTAPFRGDPWRAYRRLRRATPTPFAGYLGGYDQAILSLSPERFIGIRDGHVETRPIKGTRPRGATPDQDRQLADELRDSPKDRAENVMIVDLLRNDLGRVCRPGSVRVPTLCGLESYANVHHLVSVIQGELAADARPLDLLSAAFPGGSITGAPKHRAMQIIDELEPSRRSVYCGSLGYVDRRGRLDTSIAIRTLVADAGTLHIWGGGGVVADSEEEAEYQESIAKIAHLMRALHGADSRDDENDSQ
ncbi:aminodeoxychorismate synthase component I [Salinicola avicenniae]|uniref:aminodeoxychorismate synthase component I n=1 Tax=Salinicola avicenniae TaxID=2916836 RepID=UPI002073FD97|nr:MULTISPECIES: aminodeoxychorismate synthase component I [unclassified Salinicola]